MFWMEACRPRHSSRTSWAMGHCFLNTRFPEKCPKHACGVKSSSPARASGSAAHRIPYARSTWAACPAKRRAYSTTWNVRARRGLSRCAAPPAHILHDHASGEDSIDDIVRALENGTVRDVHVRQLDLSGTQRQTTAPCAFPARSVSQHTTQTTCCNRQCGDRWLSPWRR